MISGMIGYKWAVEGSNWLEAAVFGIVAMIVNIGLAYLIKAILNINTIFLGYIIFGLSIFLTALYYKKKPNKVAMDITFKAIIVSVLISVLLLALAGFLLLTAFGSLTVI